MNRSKEMAVLHTEYLIQSENIQSVPEIDKDIFNYIQNNNTGYFDDDIKDDSRLEVFLHLSELRKSLLNWYEFIPDAYTLEIGGGFGAITGLLCEKCAHVYTVEHSEFRAKAIYQRYEDKDNLDVYCGDVFDIRFDRKFDYIVLTGAFELIGNGDQSKEIYVEYLKQLAKLLKQDGKILLSVNNRYAIRYFCGATDEYTGKPFGGINRQKTNKYLFNKHELVDIIKTAGIPYYKFYYPLPDYKLPQVIYSDRYLPEKNINERLIPYYVNNTTLVAFENDLYNDIVENNVFEFFANSFLVECSNINDFCTVDYAAVSTDRGKENSFATTIHADNIVKKTALYPQGTKSIERLYENIEDLKSHGLDVVEHKLSGNSLIMPYIKADTLSNYLKSVKDKDELIGIIDKLYECILASSEQVPAEKNALMNRETQNLNWGAILKKVYMELIPLNAFYDNGKIIFYDQEFVRENYPAKYTLFRALYYLYIFAPEIENIVPLEEMKQRYEMSDVWSILKAEEDRFINEIRKCDTYKEFYKWAYVDRNNIQKNMDMLLSGKDDAVQYKVSDNMKKIWAVQLDLLKKFREVCEKNNLKYYIIYGTLLGAVRHKGFIPWDDDVDVAMPREDFEKLIEIAKEEFISPYYLQTMENDTDCFNYGYARLRNSNTTGIAIADIGHKCNNGIWIDILPLDVCINDRNKLDKQHKKIKDIQYLLTAKVYGKDSENFAGTSEFRKKLYSIRTKFYTHKGLCKRLTKIMTKYNNVQSEYICIFTHRNRYQAFNKADFDEQTMLVFENEKFAAPSGYKRCLEMSMGRNYMQYPPVSKRKPHHIGIFDPDRPYQEYNMIFMNIFDDIYDKTLVIFGAGLMFEDYMKKHGSKYRPEFLVDNDKAKWGTQKHGITVRNPDALLELPKEKRHVIICSVYYKEIEQQLKKMGIDDYKVYIQEKSWITTEE